MGIGWVRSRVSRFARGRRPRAGSGRRSSPTADERWAGAPGTDHWLRNLGYNRLDSIDPSNAPRRVAVVGPGGIVHIHTHVAAVYVQHGVSTGHEPQLHVVPDYDDEPIDFDDYDDPPKRWDFLDHDLDERATRKLYNRQHGSSDHDGGANDNH